MSWHIFSNVINIFIWLLNTLKRSYRDGLFTSALLAWFLHDALPQLQVRSNHKDNCHRILVPKLQVQSIFQCFGLIFILMDPLGALLSTLGANLLKVRFFRDTLYFLYVWTSWKIWKCHFLVIFNPSKTQFIWTPKNTKTWETKTHITQNFEKKWPI